MEYHLHSAKVNEIKVYFYPGAKLEIIYFLVSIKPTTEMGPDFTLMTHPLHSGIWLDIVQWISFLIFMG